MSPRPQTRVNEPRPRRRPASPRIRIRRRRIMNGHQGLQRALPPRHDAHRPLPTPMPLPQQIPLHTFRQLVHQHIAARRPRGRG